MTHTTISLEQRKKQLDQIKQALAKHLYHQSGDFLLVMCVLMLLTISFLATAIFIAAAIVLGLCTYIELPLQKWSLDTRLNNYSPLDAGAFKKLQQRCRTFGDIDPVAVNEWLAIEMKSLESQSNSLNQGTSNEILPIKKPTTLQFLNRDLSVH